MTTLEHHEHWTGRRPIGRSNHCRSRTANTSVRRQPGTRHQVSRRSSGQSQTKTHCQQLAPHLAGRYQRTGRRRDRAWSRGSQLCAQSASTGFRRCSCDPRDGAWRSRSGWCQSESVADRPRNTASLGRTISVLLGSENGNPHRNRVRHPYRLHRVLRGSDRYPSCSRLNQRGNHPGSIRCHKRLLVPGAQPPPGPGCRIRYANDDSFRVED